VKKVKNKIINDVSAVALGNIITLITGIINTKIAAEFFSKAEFGLQAEIVMIVSIFLTFFTFGLNHSPHFFIPKSKSIEERRLIIAQLYSIYLMLGVFAAIVTSILFGQIVNYFHDVNLFKVSVIIVWLPLVRLLNSAFSGVMVAQNKAKLATNVNLLKVFGSLIGLSIVVLNNFSIYEFLYITFFIELATAILTSIIGFKTVGIMPKFVFSNDLISRMLSFAVPLGLSSMVSILIIESDKLFVAYYLRTEDLALYTNMTKELPVQLLSSSFTTVLLPQIVKLVDRKKDQDAIKLWGHSIIISFSIVCFIVCGLAIFSREAIKILYSAKYVDGYQIFLVYLSVTLVGMTQYSIIINAKGRTRTIFFSSISALLMNIILNFIGLYLFGMIGLTVASAITTYTINTILLMLTSKITNIPIKEIFPWRELFGILAKNLALATLFFVVYSLLGIDKSGNWLFLTVICALIWTSIYFVISRNSIKEVITIVKNIDIAIE